MERAIERGELPREAPSELVLNAVSGAVLNMVIARSPADRQELRAHAGRYATSIVDFVLAALGVRP
jgi:hypothetical protein